MNLDIGKEVQGILDEYTDEVIDATNKSISKVARKAAKTLRDGAGDFQNVTGDYRRGWSNRKSREKLGIHTRVVHNRTDYQLTHLLEFGHVNRDGTRARAFPHIAKVEEESSKELIDEIERKLR